jgi:hypothetical protein
MSVYLYANVKLKYGKLLEFNQTMAEVVPIFERRGWKLVGAWSTVFGDIHEVHDIWEVADANAVPATLAEVMADADFPEHVKALSEQIDRETLSLIAKTPFSP